MNGPSLVYQGVALAVALCVSGSLASAAPDSTPDSGAQVVFLRSNCNVDGTPMENCFESMATLSDPSSGWIWNTRSPSPSASSPLLVDVGPGTFEPFECDGGGFVTVRGAGREQSVLESTDVNVAGVDVKNCEELSFIDIGARGEAVGAKWIGTGSSSWSNTDIVATGSSYMAGWSDECDFTPYATDPGSIARSVHYFHGSRIRNIESGSTATFAFWSTCAENWFFGGEILVNVDSSASFASAVQLGSVGELRAFGTAIRARSTAAVSNGFAGVNVGLSAPVSGTSLTPGSFHSHGAIINVDAGSASVGVDVYGLRSTTATSFAHTPGTSFVVTPGGSGSATRVEVSNGGVAMSPFLWQDGDAPPDITSQHGSDLFVERDCDSSGCSGGDDPHLMIYSDACTGGGGPWFDVVRAACRQ